MADTTVSILITARNQASKVFGDVRKSASGLGTAFSGIGAGIGTVMGPLAAVAGIGFSVREAFPFATSSLNEFMDAEKQAAKLGSALKATNFSAGLSQETLQNLASDLERVTTFEGDATVGAMSMLAAFRNVKGDIFKDAIRSAMDLSARTGKDLVSSVQILGKALNDPVRGMATLRRQGMALFTAEQQTLIKSLTAIGRTADAQKIILEEFHKTFGGAAAEQAKTMAGQVEQMSNAWGNLKESVGGFFVELGLPTLIQDLTTDITKLTDALNGTVSARERVAELTGKADRKAPISAAEAAEAGKQLQEVSARRIKLQNDARAMSQELEARRGSFLWGEASLAGGGGLGLGAFKSASQAKELEAMDTAIAELQEEEARLAKIVQDSRPTFAWTRQRTGPIVGSIPQPSLPPGTIASPQQQVEVAKRAEAQSLAAEARQRQQEADAAAVAAQKKRIEQIQEQRRISTPVPLTASDRETRRRERDARIEGLLRDQAARQAQQLEAAQRMQRDIADMRRRGTQATVRLRRP